MNEIAAARLAMAASPVVWVLIALIVVGFFAPRILPVLARFLAAMATLYLRKRFGLSLPPRPRRRAAQGQVEVLPPDVARPTLRAGSDSSLAAVKPAPAPEQAPPNGTAVLWGGGLLVGAAVAVLLWYLLHVR